MAHSSILLADLIVFFVLKMVIEIWNDARGVETKVKMQREYITF